MLSDFLILMDGSYVAIFGHCPASSVAFNVLFIVVINIYTYVWEKSLSDVIVAGKLGVVVAYTSNIDLYTMHWLVCSY